MAAICQCYLFSRYLAFPLHSSSKQRKWVTNELNLFLLGVRAKRTNCLDVYSRDPIMYIYGVSRCKRWPYSYLISHSDWSWRNRWKTSENIHIRYLVYCCAREDRLLFMVIWPSSYTLSELISRAVIIASHMKFITFFILILDLLIQLFLRYF